MSKVYEMITEKIIEKLEQGIIPWKKTWKGSAGAPKNIISGNTYKGINLFMLATQCYESPYWMTFKQAKQKGGKVKKGESGTPIVYWNFKKIEDEDGEVKEVAYAKYYTVFNLEQTEGVEAPEYTIAEIRETNKIELAENIVSNYKTCPEVKHGGSQAYYMPSKDFIQMPQQKYFESDEAYYSTLFHEIGHSTGHIKRLNREELVKVSNFGSHDYSKEELVAEFTATFLNSEAEITTEFDNNVAYIQGWLKKLRNDKTLIVSASQKAQKASDYILGRA